MMESPSKSINDSDIIEEDFEASFQEVIDTKNFSKHGFDMLLVFKKQGYEIGKLNRRAVNLF